MLNLEYNTLSPSPKYGFVIEERLFIVSGSTAQQTLPSVLATFPNALVKQPKREMFQVLHRSKTVVTLVSGWWGTEHHIQFIEFFETCRTTATQLCVPANKKA